MVESPAAGELTPFEKILWRIKQWFRWNVSHRLPHLIWYGDEVDVTVRFSEDPLDPELDPDDPLAGLFSGILAETRTLLQEAGIDFDTGQGDHGRDWEWDWSLSGPISVAFRRRAKNPDKRKARPKLRLVKTDILANKEPET